jgi:transcriptional regulator with XRE-family HTH domain
MFLFFLLTSLFFANMEKMNNPAIPVITIRIRDIRTALGLSQNKFSSITALSSGYIAGVETGRIAVNERLIKLVCSSFHVNEAWLRYGEGNMFLEALPDDKRFKNLVNTVKGLPPKYQDFLFQILDMLLKLKDK